MATSQEIDDIINKAQAQAGAVTTTDQSSGSAVAATSRGAPLGLDDLLSAGGLSGVTWLKVNEYGIFVGGNKAKFDTLDVAMDLSAVQYKYSVRYGQNPVKYDHTYDHRVSVNGLPWHEALDRAKKVTDGAREYRSADLPMVTVEELKAGKDVLAEKFTTLGLTLSVTGWKKWESFVKTLAAEGINPKTDTISVELGWEEAKGNGNTWGVPTFTLKDRLEQLPS